MRATNGVRARELAWYTLMSVSIAFATAPGAMAARWYVDASAAPGGTGSSWSTAFQDIQSALSISSSGDEIWVADGTYKPSLPYGGSSNPRDKTFDIRRNRKLYGGFAGGEANLDERNPEQNITILSGDIGTVGDASDNCYHVVSILNDDAYHVLSGFTITAGNADDPFSIVDSQGAGIRIGWPTSGGFASATITRCRITGNTALGTGAGLWAHPLTVMVTNCEFSKNAASSRAGAAEIASNSSLYTCDFTNCVFFGNSGVNGGAIYIASPIGSTFTNCTFSESSPGSVAKFSHSRIRSIDLCSIQRG